MKENKENGGPPICPKCGRPRIGVARYDIQTDEGLVRMTSIGGKKCGHCAMDIFLDEVRNYTEESKVVKP